MASTLIVIKKLILVGKSTSPSLLLDVLAGLEVAILHPVHPGVGLHHQRLQNLLVPDRLARQNDLKVEGEKKCTDMQENMWAMLRDSHPGACLIHAT